MKKSKFELDKLFPPGGVFTPGGVAAVNGFAVRGFKNKIASI
jgi:hypothetical protein